MATAAANNLLSMENLDENSDAALGEINKQIFEIKKKIQLSEGQRKALFESCEAERKANADTILRLKREIAELLIQIKRARGTIDIKTLPYNVSADLPPIANGKSYDEVQELVDSKVIDLRKKLDLLRFESKQKELHLKKLAEKYEELQDKQMHMNFILSDEHPLVKKKINLENEVHRINLQTSEAIHIKKKYCKIKDNLLADSVRFENALENLETEIKKQEKEIKRLQEINNEASAMRDEILNILENEQKAALEASKQREEELNESRRKVEIRRQELHRLERRIVQDAIKTGPTIRQTSEQNSDESDDEEDIVNKNNAIMEEAFEKLKEATGAMSIPEILERFQQQRETFIRLKDLRTTTEEKKEAVEKQKQKMMCELELYKLTFDKDNEEASAQINKITDEIETNEQRLAELTDSLQKQNEALSIIAKVLHNLCVSLRCTEIHDIETGEDIKEIEPSEPPAEPEYVEELLTIFNDRLQVLLQHLETADGRDSGVEDLERTPKLVEESICFDNQTESIDEEVAIYPPSYTVLTAKSPASVTSTHGTAQQQLGSEDEDDVPSREYLKRQAQLIVDAKSRRKTFRVMIPQRK